MVDYYFETLPLHPRPARMELFTSYLTRLAKANGMGGIVDLLLAASFPGKHSKYHVKERSQSLTENSVSSFGTLPIISHCSEETLRATTFFHVGRKFGRS